MKNDKNIIVFASGSGSNFKSIQKSIINKEIQGTIRLLISDNCNSKALVYAESQSIDTRIINKVDFIN